MGSGGFFFFFFSLSLSHRRLKGGELSDEHALLLTYTVTLGKFPHPKHKSYLPVMQGSGEDSSTGLWRVNTPSKGVALTVAAPESRQTFETAAGLKSVLQILLCHGSVTQG